MRPRPPVLRLHDEIVVDNFAGGGGASCGIEWALGRSPDIAVNHDPEAVAMHAVNHPETKHYCEDVFKVDPQQACGGRRVALAWFSPDCKHFSKAKGCKPVEKKIRGLAWVVVRWARTVKPRIIILENVEEFADWGPLGDDDRPDPTRKGQTFKSWWSQLQNAGYAIEMRILRACDYGVPTTRKRLFIIARSDGQPIVWPEATHGAGRTPYRTAAECIDWEQPTLSIFASKAEAKAVGARRPLAPNTMARIGRGVWKYVIGAKEPFVVRVAGGRPNDAAPHGLSEPLRTVTAAHRGEIGLISPTLIQTGYGERKGQAPRCLDLHQPMGTIVGCGMRFGLAAAFLAKHYGSPHRQSGGGVVLGSQLDLPIGTVTARDHHGLVAANLVKLFGTSRDGAPMTAPMPTVTAGGQHIAEVRAFLTRYNATGLGQAMAEPLATVTTHDRFGVVQVAGVDYAIADIGFRMLVPRELFRAQGFDDSYRIDIEHEGKPLSKEAQVRMVGNSVAPGVAAALVAANVAAQRIAVA